RGVTTGPAPNLMTPGQISSGLVPNPVPVTPYTPPRNKELEILFQPMFDKYLEPPRVERPVLPAQAIQAPVNSAAEPNYMKDRTIALIDNPPFVNVFASEPRSKASSSGDISSTESPYASSMGISTTTIRNIERVAVCSSLRSLKSKRTIESRAKGSSKRISLGHYPIMLASSHTVKSKTGIKSPMHYPCGIARTSE
nr:hypothetical protein [Tanacetum cinerariifolium]